MGTLGGSDFFQVGLENDREYEFKQKNDSDCYFYNFSILVPYTNKFLVVYIFHGIYSSPPHYKYFFCEGQFSFSCLVARGWKDSYFLGGSFCFGRT